MSQTTINLGMPLVQTQQAQKDVTVNTALLHVDAILGGGIMDRDLTEAPATPSDGDIYIVAPAATGIWADKDQQIAFYQAGWYFIEPKEGITLWIRDEFILRTFVGGEWKPSVGTGGVYMNGNQLIQPELKDYRETIVPVTAAATTELNLAFGNLFLLDHSADITSLTISSVAASAAHRFELIRQKDASGTARSIAWPASFKWANGTAPSLTQTTSATDHFAFITLDAGTTWLGQQLAATYS